MPVVKGQHEQVPVRAAPVVDLSHRVGLRTDETSTRVIGVMVSGHYGRGVFDAITAESDFVCRDCPYVGRLLLSRTEGRSHLFLIATGPWRTVGGRMSCPLCFHTVHLSRRQYLVLPKCETGAELVAAK